MLPQYYHERACRLFRTIARRLEEQQQKQQLQEKLSNDKQISEITAKPEQYATCLEQNNHTSPKL